MQILIKQFLLRLLLLVPIAMLCCISVQITIISKIKKDIESHIGEKYAILALHSGGENYKSPSIWQLLKLVFLYETNITGEYAPMGSSGLTGKKHYLAILITDNTQIYFAEWSFRKWGLVFAELRPWDIIKNLPEADQDLYSFKTSDLEQRHGLFYKGIALNDDDIRFYYRVSFEENTIESN